MAWNYRKRIKILPGIHLNVSKKGVSTTFGVRGASITTSKRGTYLNTSIPGTGIYKREKISGKKNNSLKAFSGNTNAVTNNNISFFKVGLVLSWIVLILIALLIVSQNTTMGICFILGIIIVKIATKQKKDFTINNQENTVENNNSGNELVVDNSLKKEDMNITKEYFTNITEEIEKIILFYESLCMNDDFMIFYKNNTEINAKINNEIQDARGQMKLLLWHDISKCILNLGHAINIRTIEGFGLFYLLLRTCTNNIERFEYDHLNYYTQMLYASANDLAIQISNIKITSGLGNETLVISKVLNEYNLDLKQKYLVLIYRYASLAAKSDGRVNEKEAEWLSKILNQSNKKTVKENVVIRENEQEVPEVQQELPKVIKPKIIKPKMTKLRELIGLDSVKEEIETLTNFIKIQQEREAKGLKNTHVSYHCVFTGNPGTGKTSVARIVADIYKSLGILSKGHLVETDRSGLVAEYVGQTAVKTNKIIDAALDGVLFIDEAYSLISKSENDYGKEAIATLLKRMEDDRDRLIVILAGYTAEMQDFIDSNPGLQSRFNRYIEFPDYSADELLQVFESNLKQFDYTITNEAKAILQEHFMKIVDKKERNFGNARYARNFFEKTIERQANRLSKEVCLTEEKLSKICPIDLPI